MTETGLSHRVEGDGAPLLLVHGFGISFNIWRPLIPLLRPHFRVVMVELPGIGASPMPPEGESYLEAAIKGIEGVRSALGIERWNVLGYSTGSRIAETYTQRHAQRVWRLALLCPLIITAPRGRGLKFGLWLDGRLPAFGNWILSGWRLRFLISLLGFNLQRDPRTREWFAEIGAVPRRVLRATLRLAAPSISTPFSVPVPYLCIWGDRDLVPLTPRVRGEHDYFVHGRHAAPVESAGEVAQALTAFFGAGEQNHKAG